MMAAAISSSSRTSAPSIAFGDLLDLASWRSRSPRSVCEACQTINPGSRRYCKGCTGKLPAYYATGQRAAAQGGSTPGHALIHARRMPTASGCMGAFLIAVAAFAGLPLMESDPPDATTVEHAMLQPLAPVTLEEQAAVPVTIQSEPATTHAIVDSTSESVASAAEEEEEEAIAESPVERPARKTVAVRRQAVQPQSQPQHVAAAQSASAQLARCDEMNFFAKAMCVNRTCAQPSAARASSCAQPIRQRRLDEARRNPTLAG
ncbi:MAG: hypothetical protein ABWZ88_08895 [Variovorax sp.]